MGAGSLVAVVLWLTSGWWTVTVARSLVCEPSVAPSDAILVETFDLDYLLFVRAGELYRAGLAPRVLVSTPVDPTAQELNAVAAGIVELMARLAGAGPIEIVPVRRVEPITLNAGRDLRRFLEREHIRSLIVVTPLFRSRRAAFVYDATLGSAGVALRYQPVRGSVGEDTWTRSWHGIQDVAEQWLKLQYYRFYVLPFRT